MAGEKPTLTVAQVRVLLETMPDDALVVAEPYGAITANGVIGARNFNQSVDYLTNRTGITIAVLELEDEL
jgi:hypothetical protein